MTRPAAILLAFLFNGLSVCSQTTGEALQMPQLVVIGRIEADVTWVEAPTVKQANSETATEEERVQVRRIVFRVDRVVKGEVRSAVIGAYALRKIWVSKSESGRSGNSVRDLGSLPGTLPILKLWQLSLVASSDDRYCPTQRAPCFEMVRDGLRPVKDFYPEGRKLQTQNNFTEEEIAGNAPDKYKCSLLSK